MSKLFSYNLPQHLLFKHLNFRPLHTTAPLKSPSDNSKPSVEQTQQNLDECYRVLEQIQRELTYVREHGVAAGSSTTIESLQAEIISWSAKVDYYLDLLSTLG